MRRHLWYDVEGHLLPTQKCRRPKCMLARRSKRGKNGKPLWENGGYPLVRYGFVDGIRFFEQFRSYTVPECRG